MAKDYSQVNFRIPTKLKEQIEQSAIANERSITAELVIRLEKGFNAEADQSDLIKEIMGLVSLIDKLDNRIEQLQAQLADKNTEK